MNNQVQSNPNDFKVVLFNNKTDFDFTPEMGCMYDGRPISGTSGTPGIKAGESLTLPYHIGHRLAENLAKIVQLRRAPTVDKKGVPTGEPLWSPEGLKELKETYLSTLYSEEKPVMMSETDKLMAKVEEYKSLVDKLIDKDAPEVTKQDVTEEKREEQVSDTPAVFTDKQDVIAELEKREIKHDKRKSKAELEKLLT